MLFFLLESLLNKPRVLHVTIIRDTLILRFFASFAKSQNLILAKFCAIRYINQPIVVNVYCIVEDYLQISVLNSI